MSDPAAAPRRTVMLVNALEKEETRIALLVDGRLEDYHVERSSRETLVGNIYKGRVENVHASLQAAFVSIGLARNAFLHVSEVHEPGKTRPAGGRPGPRRLIQNLLHVGEEILVQVIRDEFGEKGPSVTMELGIPGRFLVLTPLTPQVGVSKKIVLPAQRVELKSSMRDLAERRAGELGFIVRTAGGDTDPADLEADLDFLVRLWKGVEEKARAAPAPALLYREDDLVLRTVRDFFTKEIDEVVVDAPEVRDRLAAFFGHVMPRYADRLVFHGGPTPIFHKHGLEAQIDQLNQKVVNLPSGGTLVLEQTEALTAIDVNSGRLVRESNPEELALRTNLEAAREVVRQLRLRDIGGIIVIDFIDMKQDRNRRAVEDAVRDEMRRDRAQSVILPMSQFCLVQIARQKTRPSVASVANDPCPACGGTGFVKSTESVTLEVVRALKGTLERSDIATVEVRVGPDAHRLLEAKKPEIDEMERSFAKRIKLVRVRDLPDNRVEFTCYNPAGEKVFDFVR